MHRPLVLAVLAFHGLSCGNETKEPRSASPSAPSPPAAPVKVGPSTDGTPGSAAEPTSDARPDQPSETTAREAECKARLAQLGLEHGNDSCKPKPPAPPIIDEVQELPKKCVADSPRDKPCKATGGVYKVRLEPDPAGSATCFGRKPIETTVRLKAGTDYGDRRDLSWELGALLSALGLRDKAPRLGSRVREGVCCIDIDVSEGSEGRYRRLVLKLASGETVVNAKASIVCDDSGDKTPVKAQVTRVAP